MIFEVVIGIIIAYLLGLVLFPVLANSFYIDTAAGALLAVVVILVVHQLAASAGPFVAVGIIIGGSNAFLSNAAIVVIGFVALLTSLGVTREILNRLRD